MERLSEELLYKECALMRLHDEYPTIYFGKNMMPWLLLDCDEEAARFARRREKALLLSKYALCDMQHFDEAFVEEMNWTDSEIASWLNNEFLEENFDETAQKAILHTSISTTVQWHDLGGVDMDTQWEVDDKLFLLSEAELNRYFPGYSDTLFRRVAKGNWMENLSAWNNKAWWLRDRGSIPFDAKYVNTKGQIKEMNVAGKRFYRGHMMEKYISVRPAMYVDIAELLRNPNVYIDLEKEVHISEEKNERKNERLFKYVTIPEKWVKTPIGNGSGLLKAWLRNWGEICTLLIETYNVSPEDVELESSQAFKVIFESKSRTDVSSEFQMESFVSSGAFEQTPTVFIRGTVNETYDDPVEYGLEEGDTLLTISCSGNILDVVIHEECLQSEKPQVDDMISGEFWVQGWPVEE